jgi:Uma2 family endonuclease
MAMALGLRRFTVEEVERMVRAGILHEDDRLELLDGQLVEMSPTNPPHASCVTRLIRLLAPLVTSGQATLRIQDPIVLATHQAPQPDVALLRYRADGYQTRNPGPADAFLVIEVGDSSAETDRERKIPLYAGAGIAEAWLVNLPGDSLELYQEPQDGRYHDLRTARRGETVSPLALPGLALSVDDILGPAL